MLELLPMGKESKGAQEAMQTVEAWVLFPNGPSTDLCIAELGRYLTSLEHPLPFL